MGLLARYVNKIFVNNGLGENYSHLSALVLCNNSSMNLWRPFTQHAIAPEAPVVTRAEGAYLYQADGKKIFDAISSWWVTTHGHSEPHIAAAIRAQTEKLSQIIMANFTHEAAQIFVEKLSRAVDPKFAHVFLSDSGSTAMEVAIKMAVGAHYHHDEPQRTKIIAFDHAYHGDTIGTSSVGARGVFTRPNEKLLYDVLRVPSPADDPTECLKKLEVMLGALHDEIAAVVIEPLVQGSGGMKFYGAYILDQITLMTQRHGAYMIFDEVMTGFGRTGTMFAYQQCKITPDIIALAKGLTGGFLPMAATLATQEIFDAFYFEDRSKTFFHSTSYTGNALACAAAVANLELWDSGAPQKNIDALAAAQQKCLDEIAQHPAVKNPRRCGTIVAFEIEDANGNYLSDISPRLQKFSLERGVMLRPLGNTLYVLPPYCSSEADLNHCYNVMREFIDQLALRAA